MEDFTLEKIENDRRVTRKTDGGFIYEFEKALLLALVESGRLTESQYRYAEEKLRTQKSGYEKSQSAHSQN